MIFHRVKLFPSYFLNKFTTNTFKKIEKDLRAVNGKVDLKQIAMQKYHKLIGDLNNFERLKYDQFLATGTKIVNTALKSNILKLECANDSSRK